MREEKNDNSLTFVEQLFKQFKENLKSELNIYEDLTEEELKQKLIFIINDYETLFYNDYSEIFIYNYYQNLLNDHVIDEILKFVETRKFLNNTGKDQILKSERKACQDVLNIYDFDFIQNSNKESQSENEFVSKITQKRIPINYQASEIITNDNVFFRPPKGDPKLRGPHINFTIEYDVNYWLNFKQHISEYIESFEKHHDEDFLDNLKDYRYWIHQYCTLTNFLDQELTKDSLKEGGYHVKN